MSDQNQLRKRVLLRFLGSPLVLAPFVVGVTALTATWALGSRLGLGLFIALAGFLTATGAYLTRAILDDGRTARAILAEIEEEQQAARQAALDELDRRLVRADRDPRPELALRDLRALLKAFEDFAQHTDSLHVQTILEVRERARQLFDQAVRSLEQTLTLGDTAARLQTAAARDPILKQREQIVDDVRATVKQLGDTLAAIQRLDGGSQTGTTLARLRDELDEGLRVANRVEARLGTLLDQASRTTEATIPSNPQKKG